MKNQNSLSIKETNDEMRKNAICYKQRATDIF